MEHFFSLPILFNDEELDLTARLVTFGYAYKFFIMLNGREFVFERDDDRNYRMLSESIEHAKPVDTCLVDAVIKALRQLSLE